MITVLESVPVILDGDTPVLTKTFTPAGVQSYGKAFRFDVHAIDGITSIDGLSELLTALEDQRHACVIRGKLKPGFGTAGVRRLCSLSRPDATFEEQHQPWMLCDFDKVPAPSADMTNEERLDYLVGLLPPYFHGVSYHYRWSASAGTNGWDFLSCHLWFWLDQPWDSTTLRERIMGEQWECDESPFDPVHIHYTAAPIFDGVPDPMPGQRSGLVRGTSDEVVMPPYIAPVIPRTVFSHQHKVVAPNEGFEARLADIGPRYHGPIRRAIGYYCRVMKDVDAYELKNRLKDAIQLAPPGKSSKRDYMSDHYLDRLIKGAMTKFN